MGLRAMERPRLRGRSFSALIEAAAVRGSKTLVGARRRANKMRWTSRGARRPRGNGMELHRGLATPPGPRSGGMQAWWISRPEDDKLNGRLFLDGSALDPAFAQLRRAGWASASASPGSSSRCRARR